MVVFFSLFRFSKPQKYFVFRSPCSCHLTLLLRIVPFVLCYMNFFLAGSGIIDFVNNLLVVGMFFGLFVKFVDFI